MSERWSCRKCGATDTALETSEFGIICRACTRRTLALVVGDEQTAEVAIKGAELMRDVLALFRKP